jgi:hypothetical protein
VTRQTTVTSYIPGAPTTAPQWWGKPPEVLAECPAFVGVDDEGYERCCDAPVTGLSGSPTRRAHLVRLVPCGHWVSVEDANDLENGAWQ